MNRASQLQKYSATVFRGVRLLGPACLIGAVLLNLGGCSHEHEREVVVRERPRYEAPPPPAPEPAAYATQPPAAYQQPVAEDLPPYTPPPGDVMAVYGQDLTPYGRWYDIPTYGRCWAPNDRPTGWRPYTCGHWVNSDQGWVFVSDDVDASFGEICYHYGRWYQYATVGWVWVPGTVWAPSWCAWREGNGYCAWAPLPPQCVDGVAINVALVDRLIPADRYYCCEERYITEPRVDRHLIVNDVSIVNRTRNITTVSYADNQAVNRGVSVQNVERYSGHAVPKVQVTRAASLDEARRLVASGKPVAYAPPAIEHFRQSHPVKTIEAARQTPNARTPQQPGQPGRLDEKTAEQQRAQREADAQRVREGNQRLTPNAAGNVAPERRTMEQSAAERQRLNEQAAQERTGQLQSSQQRAAEERAAQERAAQPQSSQQRR